VRREGPGVAGAADSQADLAELKEVGGWAMAKGAAAARAEWMGESVNWEAVAAREEVEGQEALTVGSAAEGLVAALAAAACSAVGWMEEILAAVGWRAAVGTAMATAEPWAAETVASVGMVAWGKREAGMRATAREVVVRWAVVAAETETAMRGAGVHVDPQSAQTAAAVVAASAVAWAEDLAEEMEWPEEMVAKAAEGEAEMGMRSPCRSEVRGTCECPHP